MGRFILKASPVPTDLIIMKEILKKVIFAILITINLSVLGLGSHWVYISTLGYDFPKVTESGLREPASLKEKFGQAPMIYTMSPSRFCPKPRTVFCPPAKNRSCSGTEFAVVPPLEASLAIAPS